MKFPKLTDDLSIISKLGDNPGTDNGLTAEELKAKFDESALILQAYLNGTLVETLNELFSGGDSTPSNGLNMNGAINMNLNPLQNVRDPQSDHEALNLRFANQTFVPQNRQINGKPLSSDVTLNANDVGARDSTWLPTIAEIGAAPSCYGLGAGGIYPTNIGLDIANLARGGFFRFDTSANPFQNGTMLVVPRTEDVSSSQLSFGHNGNTKNVMALRTYNKDSSENVWEYINPPMTLGTEYRTTERIDGKAVYTKRFSFGTLPNAVTKRTGIPNFSTSYNITEVMFNMRLSDSATTMQVAYGADPGFFVEQGGGAVNIVVTTTGNFSAYTGYVTIKYTK